MSGNTIVLITGANSGLGLATAQALYSCSKAAYMVIMTSRALDRSQAAAKDVETSCKPENQGNTVVPMELVIEEDASVDKLYEAVENKFGRLDVLVNNAGESPSFGLRGVTNADIIFSPSRVARHRSGTRQDHPTGLMEQSLRRQRHLDPPSHRAFHPPPPEIIFSTNPVHLLLRRLPRNLRHLTAST